MPHDRSPFDELALLGRRFQEILEALNHASGRTSVDMEGSRGVVRNGVWVPLVDVLEDEEAVMVIAELPGVDLAAVSLRINGRELTLSGRRTPDLANRSYRCMERPHGQFHRVVTLPTLVREDQAVARLRHGLLEVRVPKRAEEPGSRVIPIDEP